MVFHLLSVITALLAVSSDADADAASAVQRMPALEITSIRPDPAAERRSVAHLRATVPLAEAEAADRPLWLASSAVGWRRLQPPADAGEGHRRPSDLTGRRVAADMELILVHDDLAWQMLGNGDPSRAEWFETLRTPSGASCCSFRDCQRTTAEWRGDTQGWWAIVKGQWRAIPADKVLDSPRTIDGDAYVCLGEDSPGDTSRGPGTAPANIAPLLGAIYCFVPPDFGS